MNQEQKKYLRERLSTITSAHRNAEPRRVEPANVKAARKIVVAFDSKRYTWGKGYRTRVDAAAAKVRETVLFGEVKAARKAIDAFEKRSFK